jgi:hypothetical protein
VRTGRWIWACPGWRDDLAAYLVGALDPQACTALRHHLGTCPACQAEYEDLVPVVGWLALLTSPGPGNMGLLVANRERAEATCNITHWTKAPRRTLPATEELEPPGAELCQFFRALR